MKINFVYSQKKMVLVEKGQIPQPTSATSAEKNTSFESNKGSQTKVFGIARQKLFQEKSWYTPLLYQKYSEVTIFRTRKGRLYNFTSVSKFTSVRKSFSDQKQWKPSFYSEFSWKNPLRAAPTWTVCGLLASNIEGSLDFSFSLKSASAHLCVDYSLMKIQKSWQFYWQFSINFEDFSILKHDKNIFPSKVGWGIEMYQLGNLYRKM